MCLAVPMKIIAIENSQGKVMSNGIEASVNLDLTPDATVGDYVIVHAGFAIQHLEQKEAEETLEILARLEASWTSA